MLEEQISTEKLRTAIWDFVSLNFVGSDHVSFQTHIEIGPDPIKETKKNKKVAMKGFDPMTYGL